jgi:hypothetical protein
VGPTWPIEIQLETKSAFMQEPVMRATQEHKIVEGSRAAVGPVSDVMRVGKAGPAAGEAAPPVAEQKRPSEARWDRAGSVSDRMSLRA